MTRHNDDVSLRQMLDHAVEVIQLSKGLNKEFLQSNRVHELALTRLVEIVGEAANRTSVDFRRRFPEIPWLEIIGLRNRLVHGYDSVDLDILITIIQIDFPELVLKLERIMNE